MQLYRYFVSQSSEFYRHNPLCCFSTSVYCCKRIFRYRLSFEDLDTPSYSVPGTAPATNNGNGQYTTILIQINSGVQILLIRVLWDVGLSWCSFIWNTKQLLHKQPRYRDWPYTAQPEQRSHVKDGLEFRIHGLTLIYVTFQVTLYKLLQLILVKILARFQLTSSAN